MQYKQAKPRTAPRQPNAVKSACVIWVMANIATDAAEATKPTAIERHLEKCCSTTSMEAL